MPLRDDLIEKIEKQISMDEHGSDIAKHPVVTLEEFFIGNNDEGSIGCNLIDHPGLQEFYRVLKQVRSKNVVSGVLVGISEADPGPGSWPFSDEIYVTTSDTADEIKAWFQTLQPNDVFPFDPSRANVPTPTSPQQVWVVWWD